MSSSDSDSDCYGGAAGLLDELKSKYTLDSSFKRLSENVNEVIKTGNDCTNKCEEAEFKCSIEDNSETFEDIQASFQLPAYVLETVESKTRGRKPAKAPTNATPVRITRSSKNSQNAQENESNSDPATSSKGKHNKKKTTPKPQKKTTRRAAQIVQNYSYPTYFIGERDDYTDHSAHIKLFDKTISRKTVNCDDMDKECEAIELDECVVNPIISVKVHWRSKLFEKFSIRKFQKITPIFEHFSKSDGVNWENLYFDYNGKILKPSDTPDSIGYNFCKFIEGGVVTKNIFKITKCVPSPKEHGENAKDPSKLDIKFQIANRKNPIFVKLGSQEKFIVAMIKLAEEIGLSKSELKFSFDGDDLDPQSTPKDLDLEGGECVDVIGV